MSLRDPVPSRKPSRSDAGEMGATSVSEHGQRTRARALRQAAILFDEVGYSHASMHQIALATGIQKPTLYHYFKAKHEILAEIHEEFMSVLVGRLAERDLQALTASDAIAAVIQDCIELLESHPHHVRVFFEHHRELPEPWHSRMKVERDAYAATVEAIIRGGIQRGELRDLDPTLTVFAIFGVANWAYTWFRADGPLTAREVAAFLTSVVTDGILRQR